MERAIWPSELTAEARSMWPDAYLEWRIGYDLPEADVLIGLMRFPGNILTQSHWICLAPAGRSKYTVLDSSDGSTYRIHRDELGLVACLGISPVGWEPDIVGESLIDLKCAAALAGTSAWELGN